MSNRIPDLKTREKSVSRIKEACLMLDALNMTLDEAIALCRIRYPQQQY